MSSVGALVACRDQGRSLRGLLADLAGQSVGLEQVVVADAGSTDLATLALLGALEDDGHLVVRTSGPKAVAWNRAAACCPADRLLVVDASMSVAADGIARANAALEAERSLGFAASIADHAAHDVRSWTRGWADVLADGTTPSHPVMVSRALWDDLRGFDESLTELAVLDFWVRALRMGARGVIVGGFSRECPRPSPGSTCAEAWRALYGKHAEAVRAVGVGWLLEQKQRALDREASRTTALREAIAEGEREFGPLMHEVDVLAAALERVGGARVDWGDLARTTPLSPFWGSDRGKPVNRIYIERFLDAHRADIRGHVLEIKDDGYTRVFGSAVTRSDVLDVDTANTAATIVADLTRADAVPADTFDCVILTQVLNVIFDVPAAVSHLFRMLAPGGVLLCTVSALDRVSYEGRAAEGDYWRFTEASLRELLAACWPAHEVTVRASGNVRSCAAHLYGLCAAELPEAILETNDPSFPLIITARARKPVPGAA